MGDAYLTPGWTRYNKRLAYQTYDVTNLLQVGPNAVGATLASGWYRGLVGFDGVHNIYGRDIALLLQLHLVYSDGTTQDVGTDGTWQTSGEGPIRRAELQRGETYDARLEKTGWSQPGYDARG